MEYLLTAAEMEAADTYTSNVIGIPSLVLMERAAMGVAKAIMDRHPDPSCYARVAIVAGSGNNGADAVAAGRMLLDEGYEVRFFFASSRTLERRSEKQTAMDQQVSIIRSYGASPGLFNKEEFASYRPDIVVDGLFGTGLSRIVGQPYASMIRVINSLRKTTSCQVYSVDIPSGIDGTSGKIMGEAIRADVTITFAFYKRGHFLYPGCTYCGEIILQKIGITTRSLEKTPGMMTYAEQPKELLPVRDSSGNKGTFGKVLVIAGSSQVSGACSLCAKAVLRMGAGMVKIFTHEKNRIILQQTVPEAMCTTYTEDQGGEALAALQKDLAWADVAAIGPGIGLFKLPLLLLKAVLDYAGSTDNKFGLVIDADAVRLLSQNDLYDRLDQAGKRSSVILTPHMAECAALLKTSVGDLKIEREKKLKEFTDAYHCTVLQKDARSLVATCDCDIFYLNTSGNDGLSSAGTGDVLTGITASCLAQGMRSFEAACAASYIHGYAADFLTKTKSRRSLMAGDLLEVLPDLT